MLPQRRDRISGRKLLDHLDVGRQPGAGVNPFEQIVAQQRRIGHPALQRGVERVHVVDPLAGEGTLVKHVLVHVRDSPRVWIDTVHAREDALEHGAAPPRRQRRRDPRLQNRMAFHDPPARCVEEWRVERVRHLAHHPPHGTARQPRVGVQRDDVTNAGRHGGRVQEGRVAGATQQPVQLVELAALALPADPACLPRVPDPAPMQQQEAVASGRIAVQPVQPGDAGRGGGQQRRIAIGVLRRAVGPVGQEGEMQLAVLAGEVVDLQPRHLVGNCRFRSQQHWYDNQGAERCGDARLQREARQGCRAERPHRQPVDARDGCIGCQDETGDPENNEPERARTGLRRKLQRHRDEGQRERHHGSAVAPDAPSAASPLQPRAQRRPVSHRGLEPRPAAADEVVTRVAPPLARMFRRRCRRGPGDVEFGAAGPPRHCFDGGAIKIACSEIHAGEGRGARQDGVNE